ncbi:hypothetical protein ACHQM5_028739 [Ranunculus cassubicifolius]
MDKKMKKALNSDTSIDSITDDNLSMIFSNLDHFGLARSICVNKSWRDYIHESTILQKKYERQKSDYPDLFNATSSIRPATLKNLLNDFAMQQHKMSFLNNESVYIHNWEGDSEGGQQCRMKMGRILTGVGDKLLSIWSLESYKRLEKYSAPASVIDIDFDERRVVGLLGSRIGIWSRHGKRTISPSPNITVTSGLCMRYIDQEVVVGCGDGAARVYDIQSEKCSHTIKMHAGPVTCLALTDDHLILSGSSIGSVKLANFSNGKISTLKCTNSTGITTLCYNSSSSRAFVGSNSGHLHCWDLRIMGRELWKKQVSLSKIYSVQHMQKDESSVVVGGRDGVLRIVDQDTGEILSSYVIDDDSTRLDMIENRFVEREKGRTISIDENLDRIPKARRPAITCLAVGMQKVITTHADKVVRVWKFSSM